MWGMAENSYGQSASDTNKASVRHLEITTSLARDRWKAFESLYSEGYATPDELRISEKIYKASLTELQELASRLESHNGLQNPLTLIPVSLKTTKPDQMDEDWTRQVLIQLPGLSRHAATRRFSTLLVNGVDLNDAAQSSNDYLISDKPRRNLIEKRIAIQDELIRRLQENDLQSKSSNTELGYAKTRRDLFESEKETVTPLTVVSRPSANSRSTVLVSYRPDSLKDEIAPSDNRTPTAMLEAIHVATSAAKEANVAVKSAQNTLAQHSRRLKVLRTISDKNGSSDQEIDRERLLCNAASASLAHARESLQCRRAELRFLQVLESTMEDQTQSSQRLEAVLELLRSHAHKVSAVEEWSARAKYLQWKYTAMQDLFTQGHASWWETTQAELAVAEAEAAQLMAANQITVANRVLLLVEKSIATQALVPADTTLQKP